MNHCCKKVEFTVNKTVFHLIAARNLSSSINSMLRERMRTENNIPVRVPSPYVVICKNITHYAVTCLTFFII